MPPVVLTIAGSDSSAGAGIQADIKAIHAAGCYALTALTAVVAEVPGHVRTIHNLPASLVEDQIRVCFEFYPIAAVKTGMLPTYEIIHTVSKLLNSFRSSGCVFYLIVDPVMVASAGDKLISDDAIEAYRTALLPIADLV
ncbi:MAG: hydroxymethylpyrimidine/phosphomethylpyrimidine kinase, partial [Chthoniobacterales bacterium]|nr:hydroxymethylpyrimidine/phosphomethylpyrimidine kinase [Chthoniobacterales bacterium]